MGELEWLAIVRKNASVQRTPKSLQGLQNSPYDVLNNDKALIETGLDDTGLMDMEAIKPEDNPSGFLLFHVMAGCNKL